MNARFVPVEVWPGKKTPPGARAESRFKAPWSRTLDDLDRELFHLDARDVLIQGYFRQSDIRNDGWPRSGVFPSEPGVILSFKTPKKDAPNLSFPCDTYTRYTDNLRAIALSLEALRAVERYGVTRHSEQYKGWAKLPPAPDKMSAHDAVVFISLNSGFAGIGAANFKDAYRAAAKRLHPDNSETGNPHLFHLLTQAKEVLEAAYGW
jgi:hypothetical protein